MKNSLITNFEKRIYTARKTHPDFRAGDTVRVLYKIQEGADKTKFRIQPFEGVVIRKKNGTADSSFTVRKMGANGVGIERVFPLYSPFVDGVELVASGVVRRSRLYYLRNLAGKAARIRSRYHGRKATVLNAMISDAPSTDAEVAAELGVNSNSAPEISNSQAKAQARKEEGGE
jgi:large subunit ribosomal protein L19